MEMVRIPEEMRQQVAVETTNAKGQREVARILNIGQTTVRMIWQRFLDTGSTDDRPKFGRQSKASKRERRCLCRYSKANPFATARQIYEEVGGSSAISISIVKLYLRNEGLFGRVTTKKQLLTKRNIQKRIACCKGYSNYTHQD